MLCPVVNLFVSEFKNTGKKSGQLSGTNLRDNCRYARSMRRADYDTYFFKSAATKGHDCPDFFNFLTIVANSFTWVQ